MRELRNFAENHAYDVYEPEDHEENQESYDDIIEAVEVITNYLNETA